MRIYRVEDENGEGMYRSNRAFGSTYLMQDETMHPSPKNDSSIGLEWMVCNFDQKNHRFGFCTLAQLRMWIHNDEIRSGLHNAGMRINAYELDPLVTLQVDDVKMGDTQAIFDRSLFKITETLSLLEI